MRTFCKLLNVAACTVLTGAFCGYGDINLFDPGATADGTTAANAQGIKRALVTGRWKTAEWGEISLDADSQGRLWGNYSWPAGGGMIEGMTSDGASLLAHWQGIQPGARQWDKPQKTGMLEARVGSKEDVLIIHWRVDDQPGRAWTTIGRRVAH